jgi:transposase
MGKPYSMDLRERVVSAVKTGGMSCNRVAKQFGVGISTVINWVKRLRETGSIAPGKMGGHKPKKIAGEHRVWLLQRIKSGDFTLRAGGRVRRAWPSRSTIARCGVAGESDYSVGYPVAGRLRERAGGLG